jgi:hypothetical protein
MEIVVTGGHAFDKAAGGGKGADDATTVTVQVQRLRSPSPEVIHPREGERYVHVGKCGLFHVPCEKEKRFLFLIRLLFLQ